MANAYSWDITKLSCYPMYENNTNVVFSVSWRRRIKNAEYSAEVCGTQNIPIKLDNDFIPYDHLTKMQVESWLIAALGDTFIQDMDANLAAQVAALINPPVIHPALPWGNGK